MDLKDYQKLSYRAIQPHTDNKDEVLNWAVGLSEEVGEVMSLLKHRYYGGERWKDEEMAKEIGDVLWYLSALSTACNLSLEAIADLNCKKLQHRFPDCEFTKENSSERHVLEKRFDETEECRQILSRLKLRGE